MKRLGIRHLSGPLAGRQVAFPADRLRIVIGTASACQVRFPAGGTDAASEVSPEHCELRRDAGRYEVRVNSADPVFIDGRRVGDGEELADGVTLQLGSPSGPSFEVRYLSEDPAVRPPATGAASRLRRNMRRHPRAVRALVAVAVLTAVAAVAWSRHAAERRRADALFAWHETESRIARAIAVAEERRAKTSWVGILERVRPSVYQILQQTPGVGEEAVGTGWVVAPGRLATNAHVAAAILEIRRKFPQRRFVARSSVEPYDDALIARVVAHPAFKPFEEAWAKYAPLQVDAAGRLSNRAFLPSYNVAVLEVEGRARLQAPLPRAPQDTLRAMRPGEPLALVGFPSEQLIDVDLARPNPRSQIGSVVSLTSFTRSKAAEGQAQLIEHSIPATGGASGSPIVNPDGLVVALLSAGNIVMIGDRRTPSAALVNFAQRVDLLESLLPGGASIDVDGLRRSWQQDLRRYDNLDRRIDQDIVKLRQQWARQFATLGPPQELRHETLRGPWMTLIGNPSFSTTSELAVGHYMIIVRGDSRRDVNASAYYHTGALFGLEYLAKDEATDAYPTLTFRLDVPRRVVLSISDATKRDAGAPDEGPQPVELWVLRIPTGT